MRFLVTMEMLDEKVPKDPQHLVHHVTQVIKHHEATIKMENDKKILAGGAVVGKKMDTFIIDTESNEELQELLMNLPLHHVMRVEVIPLAEFNCAITQERQGLENLKKHLK